MQNTEMKYPKHEPLMQMNTNSHQSDQSFKQSTNYRIGQGFTQKLLESAFGKSANACHAN